MFSGGQVKSVGSDSDVVPSQVCTNHSSVCHLQGNISQEKIASYLKLVKPFSPCFFNLISLDPVISSVFGDTSSIIWFDTPSDCVMLF